MKRLSRGFAVGSWLLAALCLWVYPALARDELTEHTMKWLHQTPSIQREAESYRSKRTIDEESRGVGRGIGSRTHSLALRRGVIRSSTVV